MNMIPFPDHLAPTSPFPLTLEIDRAEGIYIYDKQGQAYMDLVSGIAVNNIGHRNSKVVQAIKDQLDKYMHVIPYGEFIQEPQVKLAKKLASILPAKLNTSYFVNSGTEANEGAIKLAKRYTGRTEIISFYGSYHGSTHGSLSVTGNEKKKNAFRPLLPDVRFLRFNHIPDLESISAKTAAVIIEPIQGDAGVRIPSSGYLKVLRRHCDRTGALLIFDEIQTGFGRTGRMFAFEHSGVFPDILTLAKALGGGMPIGAFISDKEIMAALSHHPILGHITTFGGHPVNCTAALANLEVLTGENIIEKVEEKGKLFESLLSHPAIREIRRIGLMMAVEFENEDLVQRIVHACLKKGLITFWFLSTANSFRLQPPLIISNEEITKAAGLIMDAIKESL